MAISENTEKDINHGLDSCVALRIHGGESKEVARQHCLEMFKDLKIREAFECGANPKIIGKLVFDWDCVHDPRMKWFRDKHKLKKLNKVIVA